MYTYKECAQQHWVFFFHDEWGCAQVHGQTCMDRQKFTVKFKKQLVNYSALTPAAAGVSAENVREDYDFCD